MMFATTIEFKQNVYEAWDNKNYGDILDYLLMANDNPSCLYIETVAEKDMEDCCPFVPKPDEPLNAIIQELAKEQAKVLSINRNQTGNLQVVREDGSILMPPALDKLYVKDDGVKYDDLDMEQENMMDIAAKREQASVPTREYIDEITGEIVMEEFTIEDQIGYSFQDAVDDLSSMRDCADELQEHEDSDFCQEVANVLYRNADPVLRDLRDIAQKHGQHQLTEYANTMLGKLQKV